MRLCTGTVFIAQLAIHCRNREITPVAAHVVTAHDIRNLAVVGDNTSAACSRSNRGFRIFDGKLPGSAGIADHRLTAKDGGFRRAHEVQILWQCAHVEEGHPGLTEKPLVVGEECVPDPRRVGAGNAFVALAAQHEVHLEERAHLRAVIQQVVGLEIDTGFLGMDVEVRLTPCADRHRSGNVKIAPGAR